MQRKKNSLLKLCSVLPALLVMPAMAGTETFEGTGTPVELLIGDQYQDGGRIWLKGFEEVDIRMMMKIIC